MVFDQPDSPLEGRRAHPRPKLCSRSARPSGDETVYLHSESVKVPEQTSSSSDGREPRTFARIQKPAESGRLQGCSKGGLSQYKEKPRRGRGSKPINLARSEAHNLLNFTPGECSSIPLCPPPKYISALRPTSLIRESENESRTPRLGRGAVLPRPRTREHRGVVLSVDQHGWLRCDVSCRQFVAQAEITLVTIGSPTLKAPAA